ncbi:hypothetical protein [Undibacterium sp.]|jgi:hypothetical protein|uniref:hypothetical protein n=1 Tax=Undibacterium sp. TaxID=1914977 RepID=UPI0027321B3B|nr:hypothetical protein [Undibacterium sp.]MDP1979055.1 hypothetical protein [Undibacterium sp.]
MLNEIWGKRLAALWTALYDMEAQDFIARIDAMAAELPQGAALACLSVALRETLATSPSLPFTCTRQHSQLVCRVCGVEGQTYR